MSRFLNPFPQFFNSTPTVLSGAKLFFYAAGTSTKLNTYPTLADRIAGTNANANPITLNSWGYPPGDIFLQNRAYKVVLALSTDSDPPTSPIWTTDNYWGTDFSSVVETKVGSGAPTGNVAGTASSAGVLPTFYWDYTNRVLYVCTTTGDAASAGWTAVNGSATTPAVPPPQGYLTLASGSVAIGVDYAAKTAVYYTPDVGNLIPIYNGASMTPTEFAELTLTLVSSHVADAIYDVFVWSESGVLTIGTGPAWTTATAGSCARGSGATTTELTRVNGLWVNAVQITARNGNTTYTVGANLGTYVGSIFMDSSAGQVTCHTSFGQSRKWGVWNAYNRRPIVLQGGDATASWDYNSPTVRQANAATGNKITSFCGLAEETVEIHYTQSARIDMSGSGTTTMKNGIGVNSTTAYSSTQGIIQGANGGTGGVQTGGMMTCGYLLIPSLGINSLNMLESSDSNANQTHHYFGGVSNMLMTVRWMG